MADNSAGFRPADDDVFGRIADRYDRLCDVFSLGIHRLWKSRMAARIAAERPGVLLDLASGTGDIPCRLWRRLGLRADDWRIHVTDISPQMLEIARRKLSALGAVTHIDRQDAYAIDLPDGSVDVVSMAFGLKITDRSRVLPEVLRVLKPGGVFLCLEASRIVVPGLHPLYLAYMDVCMPWIGRLATGGDPAAYGYLLRGIHDFPDQRALTAELSAAGFVGVSHENQSLGIVALHRAVKPTQS
jgi:ubiquinone/menaquinone biosynthesis methyltransferase